MNSPLLVVDVAHPARAQEEVEAELLDALARVRSSKVLRLLKIVHGYGASGRGGATKTVVQNWLYRNRREVRSVLPGETYDLLDSVTQTLRSEVGQYPDPDLGNTNRGITIVWVW
jgi:hypothetical protein